MKNIKYSIVACSLILSFILFVSLAYSGGPQKPLVPQSGSNPTISPVKPSTPTPPAVPQASHTIIPPGPTIIITSPGENERVFINSKYKIQWDKIGQMSQFVNIALVRGDGKIDIASYTPNNGFYEWLPSPGKFVPGKFQLRITTSDNVPKIQSDSAKFELVSPYIKFTSPKTGDALKFGKSYTFTWDILGNTGSQVKIFLIMVSKQEEKVMADCPNTGLCEVILTNKFLLTNLCAPYRDKPAPFNICPFGAAKQYVYTYDPNDEYILRIESNGGYKS